MVGGREKVRRSISRLVAQTITFTTSTTEKIDTIAYCSATNHIHQAREIIIRIGMLKVLPCIVCGNVGKEERGRKKR